MDVGIAVVAEAADLAVETAEVGEALDSTSWRDVEYGVDAVEAASELESVAHLEGWSMDELNQAMDESLGVSCLETEPLFNSDGEITEWLRPEEKAHYDAIGLQPNETAGRETLLRSDIDWDAVDEYGRTNLERAQDGFAPLDARGNSIELHHVQQRNDGVLAELTAQEHRGKDIDGVLHDKLGPSEIDREGWPEVRRAHWQARAQAELRERGLA